MENRPLLYMGFRAWHESKMQVQHDNEKEMASWCRVAKLFSKRCYDPEKRAKSLTY